MSGFDDREKAEEQRFAHNSEVQFKIVARRNKLLGLWVAEQLGLSGAEAEAYAKEVVAADFDEPGDEDVFRKVRADLDAKEIEMSDHRLRTHMGQLLEEARAQIASES